MSTIMGVTLDHLRRFAVANSLFTPTTLKRALHSLGFVQADPIRAPARAQDLMLRHRVKDYRAGDLERRYAKLGIEEDFFVNYGFVTSSLQALMHPRSDTGVPAEGRQPWPAARKQAGAAPAGVRARTRRGAPARGGRPFLARHGEELLGRLVERHHPSAGRDALPRPAARGAARGRHSHLRRAPAWARSRPMQPRAARGSTRWSMWPSASTRRCPGEPVVPCAPAALCRAAVARRVEGRLAAGQTAARACARRWRRLVLAGRRGCGAPRAARTRCAC